MATMNAPTKLTQIRLARRSPAYWRVTIDNPPINVMGPEMVKQVQEIINALEADDAEPEGLRLYRSSPYREFPAGIIMEVDG